MDDVPEARELDGTTVESMLQAVDSALTLEDATPTERGFCSVYHVEATEDGDPAELYLKASPDEQAWAIPTEARLQAVLDANTSIPVPDVLGVVDDHEALPTPFYLMRALDGVEADYEQVGYVDDEVLRRLARETGAYLGDLHSVPAGDAFGHVRHAGPALRGDAPSGHPDTLAVGDGRDDWPTYLRERVDAELDRHADSAFSALTPELERWFDDAIAGLEGPFDPVLGRNDHGLHNLLIDPETGEITGMLDWGYTLAVPASFDFAFAAYLYSGAFLAGVPTVRDRRPLVRDAMLAGYRSRAPDRATAVADNTPCYELLAMVRIMNDFHHLTLPDGAESAVMDRIRADVREILDG